jgi:hypothetical protein
MRQEHAARRLWLPASYMPSYLGQTRRQASNRGKSTRFDPVAPQVNAVQGGAMSDRGTDFMSFGEAIQTVFRKYAEFTGRAGRAEFWWWALFTALVGPHSTSST